VADVQMAADAFKPLYTRLNGRDGFVSLEVTRIWPLTPRAPSPRDASSGRR